MTQQNVATSQSRTKARTTVKPRHTPLWKARGWREDGNVIFGYYRTRLGAFRGRIYDHKGSAPRFYIDQPPEGLQHHEHAACFRHQGKGRHLVHFGHKPQSADDGIIAIERILQEVMVSRRDIHDTS